MNCPQCGSDNHICLGKPKAQSPEASVDHVKLPAVPGSNLLSMNARICVGFGSAMLLQNGKPVWIESSGCEFEDSLTVKQAEQMAELYPDCDWRIHMAGPLSGGYWQRQGKGLWVLYSQDNGFA